MREIQRVLDEIASELGRAAEDVQRNWRRWRETDGRRVAAKVRLDIGSTSGRPRGNRIQDIATEGSCAMRYLVGYLLKGFAVLHGLGGLALLALAAGRTIHGDSTFSSPGFLTLLSLGLAVILLAQMSWWAGRLLHRSADRKRYAQLQARLLRLAREKDGSLTVLEAAADGRMTVEKAEEILRELVARGHVEVRVSDSGMMVYHFPEIERWDEKRWARPVDEL
jgi:hypothetical protein